MTGSDEPGEAFRDLVAVMAQLRGPDGCPWDREQTHASLAEYLLEETYEVLEAIDADDLDALREELGDLVLQIVFHSEIADEGGAFTVSDVLDGLRSKLVHRHPHVFGDVQVDGADEVLANWERSKREEKGTGVLDGIPKALPALARASKVYRRAVGAGFDFAGTGGSVAKLDEEMNELKVEVAKEDLDLDRLEAELGDVLFMVASLGLQAGVDPEAALRRMLDRFARRFKAIEAMAGAEGRTLESLSPGQWGQYWVKAKEGNP